MAENTDIEWATHSWSPWLGCAEVGPPCDHCYARSWAKRIGKPELWEGERQRTSADYWKRPLKWEREAAASGEQIRVFPSLCDPFDNHDLAEATRPDFWRLIRETPHLTWTILTKRIGNARKMLPEDWGNGYPNVWLVITVGDQKEADRDIPKLLELPARVRGLSIEPMLGPITLQHEWKGWRCCVTSERAGSVNACNDCDPCYGAHGRRFIDWVIAGGESGPKARPMHPNWARSLRDQCQAAGVPYFFKQWGDIALVHVNNGNAEGCYFQRVGKKRAGRMLDGRTWDEFPKVAA